MRSLWTLLSLLCCALMAQAAGPRATFTENKGQWPSDVLYRVMLPNGALFVERSAFTYLLQSGGPADHHGATDHAHTEAPYQSHAFRVHFEGGSAHGHVGGVKQAHYENFFLGNDAAQWGTGCAIYGDVTLKEVWPGIDLRLDGRDGLKYELIVAPGADPTKVRFRYEGQDALVLKDGRVEVQTTAGTVIEEAPHTFQSTANGQRTVPSHYDLNGDQLRFALPDGYDPTQPLTIDPTLAFASYSGSNSNNFGFTATYDGDGHLYGGGIVFGANYPITLGVQDDSFNGGTIDVGISKWSTDGASLVWSTYYGGTGNESPHSMVVNDNDELFVLGSTGSSNLPTTAGCLDNTFGGGTELVFIIGYGYSQLDGTDMFVAHFNSTATALIGSTYIGGPENDGINNDPFVAHNYGDSFRGEIIVDAVGNAVVASTTASTGLPVVGGPQPAYGGGAQDGYCFRLNPTLSTVLWSTYIGGSGVDAAYGVQVDSGGELFVTGGTTSSNLHMAPTAFQPAASGNTDGFIMRYSTGGTLIGSTYLGTSAYDQCYFVQLNTDDEVFVVGQTHGAYPVTPGKYVVPGSSQFIHKFDHALGTSLWSTRFGNGDPLQDMSPTAFLVSDCEQIYFSGWGSVVNSNAGNPSSTTTGMEVTSDAFQAATDGNDFYLMLLDPEATALNYATFFGGGTSAEHVDGGTSRFDKDGTVYQAVCAGCQNNDDFPTTPGAWSNTNNSNGCNLGVFKFNLAVASASIDIDGPGTICIPGDIQFVNNSSGGDTFLWEFGDGGTSDEFAPLHTYTEPGTYTVTMQLTDSYGCSIGDTTNIQVVAILDPEPLVDAVAPLCPGDSVQVTASTGLGWSWFPSANVSDPTLQAPYIQSSAPGTYGVAVTGECGTDTAFVTITVVDPVGAAAPDTAACVGSAIALGASGGGTYLWSPAAPLSDPTAQAPIAVLMDTTVFTVRITTPDGCEVVDSMLITTYTDPPLPILADTSVCEGGSVVLTAPEGYRFQWQPAPGIAQPDQRSTLVSPTTPTWYIVNVDNGCGSVVDSAFVDVIAAFAQAWPDTMVCAGETVTFFATPGVEHEWSPTSGLTAPDQVTTEAVINGTITYSVQVTEVHGCVSTASVTATVFPITPVVAYWDQVIELGEEARINAVGVGTFEWTPANSLNDPAIAAPIARPQETTTYTVTLTDLHGCKTTDAVTITLPGSLFVPNTFTPNGDGFNDQFGVWGKDLRAVELFVFNRWGELIWSTEQLTGRWDGTYGGIESPIDTYVWKVKATEITGKVHDRVGHVNLVR
ncbi:MAG: gliding motility-associated C-terminal domain-containing protein [Flavobacteriales bacterium]|nr:gliding motility-associated C-terminal domain-containing protein [Flavobacteriales bacterium]